MPQKAKRVCLFTGASGRLGSAFLERHARAYDVAAVHCRTSLTAPTQHQQWIDPLDPGRALPENRHAVFAIQADLADAREVDRVVELALARFGRIDLLVNAAAHSVWAPMLGSDALLGSLSMQFQLNAVLPLQLALAVSRHFWRDRDEENRAERRHVVNVSSLAACQVFPGQGQGGYAASKAALNTLSLHMADEFRAIGVRVNVLCPNSFPSIVPTEQVAKAIVDLDAGEATGQLLLLDGEPRRDRR